jgi:hypothetical protein
MKKKEVVVCAGWWKKWSVGGGEDGSLNSSGRGVVDPGGRGTSAVFEAQGGRCFPNR